MVVQNVSFQLKQKATEGRSAVSSFNLTKEGGGISV
jgi:hypothetical protein